MVENELRYNIATSYHQYLQTLDAVKIFNSARTVLQSLARLNEKLVSNNVATKEVVTQARYEISKVDQQLAVAEKDRESARAYVNFLLNRDLLSNIPVDSLPPNHCPSPRIAWVIWRKRLCTIDRNFRNSAVRSRRRKRR